MATFYKLIHKIWIFAVAATLIFGSNVIMSYVLGHSVLGEISGKESYVDKDQGNHIFQANNYADYTLIDKSKVTEEFKETTRYKLSMQKGITPEQIENQLNDIIVNMTPGSKDMSAQQAAANAADIAKKAFLADLKGYRALANFSKVSVPNSDSWSISFDPPELTTSKKEDQAKNKHSDKTYSIIIDSIKGTLKTAYYGYQTTSNNLDLSDPAWVETAKKCVMTFLNKDTSITKTKVIDKQPDTGVTVVCELSNGSAYSVRMIGKDKTPVLYDFFPNGNYNKK